MEQKNLNVVENIINAISILNKTDEYLDSLSDDLSNCDLYKSDFEHFIENTPIEEVDLENLYLFIQHTLKSRRKVKNDIILRDSYRRSISRLNNTVNREFLIQEVKNTQSKLSISYKYRLLTDKDIEFLKSKSYKKRGRPKKKEKGKENV